MRGLRYFILCIAVSLLCDTCAVRIGFQIMSAGAAEAVFCERQINELFRRKVQEIREHVLTPDRHSPY